MLAGGWHSIEICVASVELAIISSERCKPISDCIHQAQSLLLFDAAELVCCEACSFVGSLERKTVEWWKEVQQLAEMMGVSLRGAALDAHKGFWFLPCEGRLVKTCGRDHSRFGAASTTCSLVQVRPSRSPIHPSTPPCSLTDNSDRRCTRSASLRAKHASPSDRCKLVSFQTTPNESAQIALASSEHLCNCTSQTKRTKWTSCCGRTPAW